ncbi:MAG TPA: choice-of-anchor R domain-containing protein [Patescibacteria group bacterium]|nr:choice-of-anchor R domain-containing protein [Patescibacteria group bacterium]
MHKHANHPQTSEQGQIIIIALVFVLITISLVGSLVAYTFIQVRAQKQSQARLEALNIAEAGIEAALWKLNNQAGYAGETGTSFGAGVYDVATTDISGDQKLLTVDAYVPNSSAPLAHRIVSVTVSTGTTGVGFNYGVQVGQGGLDMDGSGTINGNVYANGPITGDSSSVITGTAISADSPALSADQSNGSGTPANNIAFANASATQDIAQSFSLTGSDPLNEIQLYIKKVGSPADATVKIVNDASGNPGTTVYASGTLSSASVTTSYGWINVTFTSNPLLNPGTTYWLVVDAASNSSKYYMIGADGGGIYANGMAKIGRMGSTWNNTTPSGIDYFFNIFLGGVNGLIAGSSGSQYNQLHVGTVSGTAEAHTVNYTNATGEIFCQTGTGNNKSCSALASDPVYVDFPVSDANIAQWESEAEAGGTYNGNYTVGFAGASLGPQKIVGDLTVSNGGTLTVTGTLYVTGNITLNGGGEIKLTPGYGSNDGVIVADGTVTVSGGGHATGSGTSGSYIMMISNDSSTSAMSVAGGAGAVIMFAPKGTLAVSGGASLKEATAYRLTVGGGSSVTYESGLANSEFSSGPGGSWVLQAQSWQLLR